MSGILTLILNGSPSPKGNTMTLAGAVADAIPGERESIDTYRLRISPCLACGYCDTKGACSITDEMILVRRRLEAAAVVILASPLHFSSLTPPMLTLISRLQPEWKALQAGRVQPGAMRRAGLLVVTAGSEYPNMFEPARIVAAAAFKTMGVCFVGMVTAPRTDTLPVGGNQELLRTAAELGEKAVLALAEEGK